MYNILICDDQPDIVNALKIYLAPEGYRLFEAFNGRQALEIVKEQDLHLILMDIMMPGMDGFTVLRKIRKVSKVPAIMLTARAEDYDKILGLELGADDYITKPYTVRNVIARVRSVLRRTGGRKDNTEIHDKPNVLQIEGLQLDLEFKLCRVDGEEIKLARKEFELLAYLISHRGKICSREQILNRVWSNEVVVLDRTIDVNITRLRSKIGKYGKYIVTRSGFGYGFRD